MSIHDDIARYANQTGLLGYDPDAPFVQRIAAGLERDYYLVKLADLPEVTRGPSWSGCIESTVADFADGRRMAFPEGSADDLEAAALDRLAVARAWRARESEAAVLARRRDELAQQVTSLGYQLVTQRIKDYVDHTIDAEDRAATAEAEVARLKGES